MMRKILKILFLLLCTKISLAQQDTLSRKPKKNNIQIDFGFVHTRLIDEGFTHSKLLFRGTNPKIGLSYGRQSSQFIFNFLGIISAGDIRTKQSELAASFVNITSAVEYLQKMKTSRFLGNQSNLFAGIRLSSINYLIENEPIFDNIDLVSLHGIHFKLNYQINLNKKQNIQFAYSMPAMVYANQVLWNSGASVYSHDDLDNGIKLLTTHGRFQYLNILNNIPIDLIYKRKMGKTVDFNFKYAFTYFNNSVERPIRLYSNELLLGLKFNF